MMKIESKPRDLQGRGNLEKPEFRFLVVAFFQAARYKNIPSHTLK